MKLVNTIKKFQTFTFTGWLLVVVSFYLLFLPGFFKADILASIVGAGFIILILVFATLSLINYFIIKKNIIISLLGNQQNIFAQNLTNLTLKIENLKLFPFLEVKIITHFKNSDFLLPQVVFRSNQKVIKKDWSISFPFRGYWKIDFFEVIIQDRLNLSIATFNYKIWSEQITVNPQKTKNLNLPIICSTFRQGDILPSQEKPQGDYYDLKKYHPSDGIKKIIWKIYAKSGNLISRHPEKSATPEGKVIIYGNFLEKDDKIASICLKYINILEENNLIPIFNCRGNKNNIIEGYSNAKDIMLNSVFNPELNTTNVLKDLERILESCKNLHIKDLVIFSGNYLKDFETIEKYLLSKKIKPIFFLEKQVKRKKVNKFLNFFLNNNILDINYNYKQLKLKNYHYV